MDLQRVEVLKGPQGTLYGQGSVAGAIRYITNAPRLDAFEGKIDVSETFIDDGDSKETVTGVLNVPLVADKLAVRLAATYEQGGGWQDQPEAGIEDGNDQDLLNVRAKALWQINDAFCGRRHGRGPSQREQARPRLRESGSHGHHRRRSRARADPEEISSTTCTTSTWCTTSAARSC